MKKMTVEDKNIEECYKMYAKEMDKIFKFGKEEYGIKVATCAFLALKKALTQN